MMRFVGGWRKEARRPWPRSTRKTRARLRRMVELRLDQRLVQRVDASDILQEGYVDISNRLEDYLANPVMPVFVWMRFLVNQRLAAVQRWHFQRQKRDPRREESPQPTARPVFDSAQLAHEFSASMTSPSGAFLREEMAQRLQRLLDGMDPADREVLVLRHFEELTNAEVAAEMQISVGAASKRYIRALGKLKKVIDQPP